MGRTQRNPSFSGQAAVVLLSCSLSESRVVPVSATDAVFDWTTAMGSLCSADPARLDENCVGERNRTSLGVA
jgi:hypothetical protein